MRLQKHLYELGGVQVYCLRQLIIFVPRAATAVLHVWFKCSICKPQGILLCWRLSRSNQRQFQPSTGRNRRHDSHFFPGCSILCWLLVLAKNAHWFFPLQFSWVGPLQCIYKPLVKRSTLLLQHLQLLNVTFAFQVYVAGFWRAQQIINAHTLIIM